MLVLRRVTNGGAWRALGLSGECVGTSRRLLSCSQPVFNELDSGSDSDATAGNMPVLPLDMGTDSDSERIAKKPKAADRPRENEDYIEEEYRYADHVSNFDIADIANLIYANTSKEEIRDLSFTFNHLIKVGRHIKVTAGGRMQSYSALVLIGNEIGTAGLGYGKAMSPMLALKNANQDAFKNVISVPLFEDRTIPTDEIYYKYRATKFHIRACPVGHGRAAHGLIGLACEAFGFQDIFAKSYGSRNEHNVLRGFFEALSTLQSAEFYAKASGRSYFNHKAIWRDKPYTQSY